MVDKRTNDDIVNNIKKRIAQERTGTTLRFEEPMEAIGAHETMTNTLCTRLLARIMIQLTKGDPDLVDGALVQNHIKMPASNVIQVSIIDARNRLRYFKVTVTEMRGPTV